MDINLYNELHIEMPADGDSIPAAENAPSRQTSCQRSVWGGVVHHHCRIGAPKSIIFDVQINVNWSKVISFAPEHQCLGVLQ